MVKKPENSENPSLRPGTAQEAAVSSENLENIAPRAGASQRSALARQILSRLRTAVEEADCNNTSTITAGRDPSRGR